MTKLDKQAKKRSTRRKYSVLSSSMYGLAVARGGSYLASTATAEGRARQLQATIDDFEKEFDVNELHFFLEDIRDWLRNRKNIVCMDVVNYYLEHGTTPPVPEPVQYGKSRKPPAAMNVKATVDKNTTSKKTVTLALESPFATAA